MAKHDHGGDDRIRPKRHPRDCFGIGAIEENPGRQILGIRHVVATHAGFLLIKICDAL